IAQGLDEPRVGAGPAELVVLALGGAGPPAREQAPRLAHEGGLADARVARDEEHPRAARGGLGARLGERLHLALAAVERLRDAQPLVDVARAELEGAGEAALAELLEAALEVVR